MGQTIYHLKFTNDTSAEINDTNQHDFPIEVWKYDENDYEDTVNDVFTISTLVTDLDAENLVLELKPTVYESSATPAITFENNILSLTYQSADDIYRVQSGVVLRQNTNVLVDRIILFNQSKQPLQFQVPTEENVSFSLSDMNYEIVINLKDNKTIITYGSTFSYQIYSENQQIIAQVIDNNKLRINNYDNLIGEFNITLSIVSDKIFDNVNKIYKVNFTVPATKDIYTLKNKEVILKTDIQTEKLSEIVVKGIDNTKDYILYLQA